MATPAARTFAASTARTAPDAPAGTAEGGADTGGTAAEAVGR